MFQNNNFTNSSVTMMKSLIDGIGYLRGSRNRTQIAKVAGMSRQHLHLLETQPKKKIPFNKIYQICNAHNIDASVFLKTGKVSFLENLSKQDLLEVNDSLSSKNFDLSNQVKDLESEKVELQDKLKAVNRELREATKRMMNLEFALEDAEIRFESISDLSSERADIGSIS